MIVGRQPVFAVFVGLDVEVGDDRRLAGHRLYDLGVEAERFVGVRQIAGRRHEKTKLGCGFRGPHNKYDIFFGDTGSGTDPQPHGIDAALQIGRNDHAVGCFPAAIGNRVRMKFDAAELRRIDAKTIVLAIPIPPGHRAHRMIDAPCRELMRPGIDHLMPDAVRAIALRGVPKGEEPIRRQRSTLPETVEFGTRQSTLADCGPIDLSSIKIGDERPAQRVLVTRPGYQKRHVRLVFGTEAKVLRDVA